MSAACRHATAADLPFIVESLIAGFAHDPLYAWLYPDPTIRPSRLRETFELVTGAALQRGHLYTNRDRTAAATWTPPDVALLDDADEREFLDMISRHIGDRREDVVAGMSSLAGHATTAPHFTLHNVAVRADAQGRGVGSELLEPVLSRCDEDGIQVHLDSSNARNVRFYERLGFAVVAEVTVPGGGPVMRAMTRQPVPQR